MAIRVRWAVAGAVVGMLAAPGLLAGQPAEPGAIPEWTREKLGRRVTIREDKESLWDIAGQLAEQTGLSFVISAPTGRMGERAGVIAREVPAGELIEALAFALRLELMITPAGVVALRVPRGDPREAALLRLIMPIDPPRAVESPKFGQKDMGEPWGERRGRPPGLDPREAVERAQANPKVADRLRALGARLWPGEFNPEKRVWMLVAKREEEGPPLGHVAVSEDGEVVGMELRLPEKERPPVKDGEKAAPAERF